MNKLTLRFFNDYPDTIEMFKAFCHEVGVGCEWHGAEDDNMTLFHMEFTTKTERSKFVTGWSKRSTVIS